MQHNVYATRHVAADYDHLYEVLRDRLGAALGIEGDAGTMQLHADVLFAELDREVIVTLGEIENLAPHVCRRSLQWRAADGSQWLPVMDGAIELVAESHVPPRTEVTFIGHYRPPLGLVGELGEAVIGHEVAASTVEDFMDQLTEVMVPLATR